MLHGLSVGHATKDTSTKLLNRIDLGLKVAVFSKVGRGGALKLLKSDVEGR